jgi:hypothetical protein
VKISQTNHACFVASQLPRRKYIQKGLTLIEIVSVFAVIAFLLAEIH